MPPIHPAVSKRVVAEQRSSRFHAVAWRWHFYAGLYVVPFLLMLAITGAVMVFFTGFQNRLGFTVHVTPQAVTLPVGAQADAVLALRSQATLREYIAPRAPDVASWFVVERDGLTEAVAVDPHTAQVL
ncbi:PepSY domain-containing protein, partial [Hydrogenophaga sp.]